MSIFKSNKFFRIIKHFILVLPLMFVLGVSLYTIVNPNAKDSYYGETINNVDYVDTITEDLQVNSKYAMFSYPTLTESGWQDYFIAGSDFHIIQSNTSIDTTSIVKFGFYVSSSRTSILFYNDNNSLVKEYYFDVVPNLQFDFVFSHFERRYTFNHLEIMEQSFLYQFDYFEYSFLSNAFEFGMYQFTNIGFGQFDFISLFNGIFTTNINNVYATFINDYINYYLFVEIIYFAPWVFHMFIHFAYDLGDYFTSSFKRNRKDDD